MRDPQKQWVSILKLSNDLDDINIQHQHTTPICIGVVLFNIFIKLVLICIDHLFNIVLSTEHYYDCMEIS